MEAASQLDELSLESSKCCLCGVDLGEPIGVGEDFEYRTCRENFLAVQCDRCRIVYLNPRPTLSETGRIYPDRYHAFGFTESKYGMVLRIRRKLEAKRLLRVCRDLPPAARILDVGCGDGFHLGLLREFGQKSWELEGVDLDTRAFRAAADPSILVHHGKLEDLALKSDHYHLVLMVMTLEHLHDPQRTLAEIKRILVPGGRLFIVTDNTGSPDFSLFKGRHWGGYHFPRHTYLFNRRNLGLLLEKLGMQVESVRSAISPVNWVYSIRNWIDDWRGPRWIVRNLSLQSSIALGLGTVIDTFWVAFGRGAILHGLFRKPLADRQKPNTPIEVES